VNLTTNQGDQYVASISKQLQHEIVLPLSI